MEERGLERELNDFRVDVTNKFSTIQTQLATIVTEMKAHGESHKKDDEKTADHEERLRQLERWRYAVPSSVIIAIGSIIANLLT